MMANDADQKRVVGGRGTKGKWHEAKLKTLEDPTIVVDVRWQNLPQPWSYTLCYSYVWWCHISKKWPHSKHETHRKNNYVQHTS